MNKNLILNRTLGFEIECFVDNYEINVPYAEVGSDGSLHGGNGEEVEVRTDPINDLNLLDKIYGVLGDHSINVNNTCGLHIHVDTSDFTMFDKAKLLRFGSGIELIMYALVEHYRQGNEFCEKLHKGWRKLFRNSYINQEDLMNSFGGFRDMYGLTEYVRHNSTHRHRSIWNGRYQWLNANVDDIPTCEFRIFSATTDVEQAQKFGILAYQIIETVKHSTVEQLTFIIKSLYQSATVDEMIEKFFDSIGLANEFRFGVMNENMASYIDTKYCVPVREGAVAVDEDLAV